MLPLWSFQGARADWRRTERPAEGRSLKTQQREFGRRGRRNFQASLGTGRPKSSTSQTPAGVRAPAFPRKEVIQPQLPLRLPCYDFTPITDPTFDGSFLAVRPPASGVADFRGVTGGVYKARERIHPGVADPGLLATPTSWSRVADSNPN